MLIAAILAGAIAMSVALFFVAHQPEEDGPYYLEEEVRRALHSEEGCYYGDHPHLPTFMLHNVSEDKR